jgi:hypothetical protein
MELGQSEVGDRGLGALRAAGAVKLLERAVDMVIDAILTGHNRPPDSGWYSTLTPVFPIRGAVATTWIMGAESGRWGVCNPV